MSDGARGEIVLQARDLCKSYDGKRVLDSLNFSVSAGKVFCLMGHNGAGKTTTLRMFLAAEPPTSGCAVVGGVAVQDHPARARGLLAHVPEQAQLYPELTGVENLEYFAGLAGVRWQSSGQAAELLLQCGLTQEAVSCRTGGYSKGMRQKVVLALARARQAKALLMDEPTSGLDPQGVQELCGSLQSEKKRGAAVLVVTHDLAMVAEVADWLGVLSGGKLVHVGSVLGQGEAEIAHTYRQALQRAPVERPRPESSASGWTRTPGVEA